jgi:hypothetical protein
LKQGYRQRPERPCALCGLPTRSEFPVCARPGKCHTERKQLARDAQEPASGPLCSLCGLPTASKFPVCSRPGKCETEYTRLLSGETRGPAQPSHPCSICGQPTRSRLRVCARPGKCATEYNRLLAREARGSDLRTPAHLCSLCGQPTTSNFQVCSGPSCINEYRRLERVAQKGTSSVYAVWFPDPQVLKIGFTVHTTDSIFTCVARRRAERRDWDIEGSRCIWKQPGDLRTEAWVQSTLAFRWLAAFEQKHRICEWFQVPDLAEVEIVDVLDGIYELVPADLTGRAVGHPEQPDESAVPDLLF